MEHCFHFSLSLSLSLSNSYYSCVVMICYQAAICGYNPIYLLLTPHCCINECVPLTFVMYYYPWREVISEAFLLEYTWILNWCMVVNYKLWKNGELNWVCTWLDSAWFMAPWGLNLILKLETKTRTKNKMPAIPQPPTLPSQSPPSQKRSLNER